MAEELQKPDWMADAVWDMLTDETKKSMALRNPTFETGALKQDPKAIDIRDNETELTTEQLSMPVLETPVVETPVVNDNLSAEEANAYGNNLLLQAEANAYGNKLLSELGNENQTSLQDGELYLSTDMYDGMTIDEARKWYNEILDRDDVTSFQKGDTYNPLAQAVHTDKKRNTRRYVPYPEKKMFGDKATVGGSQIAMTGLKEGFGDTAEFLGAAFDMLRSSMAVTVDSAPGVKEEIAKQDLDVLISGEGKQSKDIAAEEEKNKFSMAEWIANRTASQDTSGILDALIGDGIPMVVTSGGAAIKTFNKFPAASKKLGKWGGRAYGLLRGTIAAIVGETVASAQVGTEEGTLILGEDSALLKEWSGFDLEDESLAAKTMEHRINTFAEGMMLVGVLGTGAIATKEVLKLTSKTFLSGILALSSSTSSLEKQVFKDIMAAFKNADILSLDNPSPEAHQKLIQHLADIVEKNASVIVRMINSTDGSEATKEIFSDTLTAIIRGTDDPKIAANAASLQASQINKSGLLQEATSGPSRILNEELTEQARLLGGEFPQQQNKVIADTAEVVVDQARLNIDEAQGGLNAAQAKFELDSNEVLKGFSEDLEFIDILKELETVTGTQVVIRQDTTFEQITDAIRNSHQILRNETDAAFNAISGGQVDADGIINKILSLEPEQLDTAFTAIGTDKSQFGTILKQRNVFKKEIEAEMRLAAKEGDEIFIDVDNEVADRLTEWFRTQNVDFGVLYNEIRPAVSKMASMMFDGSNVGDAAVGALLRDFVKYIDTDALKFAADADPDLKPLTEAAMEAYKRYAKIFNSGGRMGAWRELYDRTVGRTATGEASTARITKDGFKQREFDENQEAIVKGVLEGGNTEQLINLADAIDASGNPELVADYMVMDLINNFAVSIRSKGMEKADYSGFAQQLRKYASALNRRFPNKAEKVNAFVAKIEGASNSQATLEPLLLAAKESADQEMRVLQENFVYKVLTSTPALSRVLRSADLQTTSNPVQGFKQIFEHKEKLNHTTQIIAIIEQLPVAEQKIAMDGLKLVYNRWLTRKIFNTGIESGGGRPMSSVKIDANLTGDAIDFDVGKLIWKDDPEVMTSITTIIDFANATAKAKNTTPVKGQSATDFYRNARTSTNRLIYVLIGPLSKAGTKARTLASAWIETRDAQERAAALTQNILSNPKVFLDMVKKYNQAGADPLLEETFVRFLTSGLLKVDVNDKEGERMDMKGIAGWTQEQLQQGGSAVDSLTGGLMSGQQ
jgi:hypothetical protein